jgi:hypothetical protein
VQKRFSFASDVSQAIQAAHEGDFTALLEDDAERWWAFARERIDLGAEELMVRVDLEDADFGLWFIWLLFSLQEHGSALALESVLIPDYENDPGAAQATPKGREQVPYFVLS